MIRSLFDTDNDSTTEKKEGSEPNESNPSPAPEEPQVREQFSEEMEGSRTVAAENDPAKNVEPFERLSELESDVVGNEFDQGDNILELESELARIEDEIRAAKMPVSTPISHAETPEKKDAGGPFTAAIDKAFNQQTSTQAEPAAQSEPQAAPSEEQGFILPDRVERTEKEEDFMFSGSSKPSYKPESKAETIRKSGLAWSAGIAFFASVIFLLIIGWFADLLFGTSPWAAVGGVVLGSIIGFIQLFRLSRQILDENKNLL
ncbi:MAG: AtpZ/AtpI family protein [Pyrinomonadaceae bacterium]|nr:AtpZ/AtpI family protein [Pyrinomonadaceae bacterium]